MSKLCETKHVITTDLKVAAVHLSHVPQGKISLPVSILINPHQAGDTWENQVTTSVL